MTGKFITFEGSEGSGKSTQIQLAEAYLRKRKRKVLVVREPGGTVISERIRDILLDVKNEGMNDICETLLYMAARAQVVDQVIRPALTKGKIVLCDRFLDSTVVYQGFGNGVNLSFIQKVGKATTDGITPDLTFLFDLPVKKGLSRRTRAKDRIEKRSLAYHNRVRKGYLELARRHRRVRVIKADQSREDIRSLIEDHLDKLLSC